MPFTFPAFGEAGLGVTAERAERTRRGHVRRAPAMDEVSFSELYAQIGPRLRGYLRRACGDAALADDLLQEAFYRFLRAALPAAEPWQTKAYLYRTANSLLVDHWRKTQRDRRWTLKAFLGGAEASRTPKNEGDAIQLFHRLPLRQQTLLWLAYVEGFEHREIAAALELSEKSVRVLLFRARQKLASALRNAGLAREEISRNTS
jgi:RNA polymerase sigma-70 factor (ECF subfamily)